jgi:hypothetical protein
MTHVRLLFYQAICPKCQTITAAANLCIIFDEIFLFQEEFFIVRTPKKECVASRSDCQCQIEVRARRQTDTFNGHFCRGKCQINFFGFFFVKKICSESKISEM